MILRLLKQKPHTQQELSEQLFMKPATISRDLNTLVDEQLVRLQIGKYNLHIYSLTIENL